ncbi:hypothetical protein N7517_002808 [Penicillium concentricum]|uniref:Heterokaryon incompatibility domain-containing protein n=1 Tax=Penicillium concentricum TaxID=293559 RepID=A0A9W9VK61_9EURO|nr:uncharacterized protein N7517_002808 [Penicillium concentricum]KAJ5384897.1 hypothetical protein N7517_002808 [Penicillium concentricum]
MKLPEDHIFYSNCSLAQRAERFFGSSNVNVSYINVSQNADSQLSKEKGNLASFEGYILPERSMDALTAQLWRNGRYYFRILKEMERENNSNWKRFCATMGSHQAMSWLRLNEWLEGAFHPQELADAAQSAIDSADLPGKPSIRNIWLDLVQFPEHAKLDQSRYHQRLAELFSAEFCDTTMLTRRLVREENWDFHLEWFLRLLTSKRHAAHDHAMCQSISHGIYHTSPLARNDTTPVVLHVAPNVYEPPPHLSKVNDIYPVYLWCISEKRTVETKTFNCDQRPDYVCVSHTWGRWKKAAETKVEGCPWDIPQNTMFEVIDLPTQLEALGERLEFHYVWLDLLCIPQTREGELGKVAKAEISRQAGIFGNSALCIAWLNYIHDWGRENDIVHWLALRYLSLTTKKNHYKEKLEQRSRLQWENRKLEHSKLALQGESPNEIPLFCCEQRSPWFSSLWTLQEATICPHMVLMSRYWSPLQDVRGIPISLGTLVLLTETVFNLGMELPPDGEWCKQEEECRTGFYKPAWELHEVFVLSGFKGPAFSSRTMILIQGSFRECSGRRAEAIMSALDVREWFESETKQDDDDLVLGVYPLRFVKEAARKIGPEFALAKTAYDERSTELWLNHEKGPTPRKGSLLPFVDISSESSHVPELWPLKVYDLDWHSTFDSWEFLPTGSVRITKAVIVGQRTHHGTKVLPGLKVRIFCEYPRAHYSKGGFSLGNWLALGGGKGDTYAIQISADLGLIFKGVCAEGELGSTDLLPLIKLVKVGCFSFTERLRTERLRDSHVKEVNWIVL